MKLCIIIVGWLSFQIKLKNLWWQHYLCGDVIINLMFSSKFKNSYISTRELIFKAKMGIDMSMDVLKHFFSPLSQYFVVISIFLHKYQFCWRQQILKLQFIAVGRAINVKFNSCCIFYLMSWEQYGILHMFYMGAWCRNSYQPW